MSELLEVRIPDIGSYKNVPVIDVCVKPGDTVSAESPLITIESEKATMDIPSPASGTVKEIKVSTGSKVSEGDLLAVLEVALTPAGGAPDPGKGQTSGAAAANSSQSDPSREVSQGTSPPAQSVFSTSSSSPTLSPASAPAGPFDLECQLLVLGGGPGGYSAAFRGADLGLKTMLVERYSSLGGVCLNVGCIPSKALLHVAEITEEAEAIEKAGILFSKPQIDLERLRAHKDAVVGKLTGGLAGMAKARRVDVIRGYGAFLDSRRIEVELTAGNGQEKTGEKKIIKFDNCIIAVGSAAVHLPFIPIDPRVVDSTGALELRFTPKKMLVIGGGIIGLEMATVYSVLGARIDVVEMLDALMAGPDRDAVRVWERLNSRRFDRVMLKTKTVSVEPKEDGLWVKFEGQDAPPEPERYDLILQSAGRTPNGKKIAAEKAGVSVNERGFIPVDLQMRTNIPHIFAIGDVAGSPMLAHKAVHEGHVAAETAAGYKTAFDAKVIPGVAYTHPEVAWAGITEEQAQKEGRKIESAKFPWAASGRAIANMAETGFTKLIFDADSKRIIGGSIVGPSAGDMIGEVCLAIEMGADAVDIGRTIHPHPTLGETIGLTAEIADGSCTDVLPPRKKSS